MFLNVSVILSMAVGFPACITGHMTRGSAYKKGGLHPQGLDRLPWVCLQGGLHTEGLGRSPPIHGILRDMVNKWAAVYILLECFLFFLQILVTKDRGGLHPGGSAYKKGVCILRG